MNEINTYEVAQVGIFRSRANIDSCTMRVGVKNHRSFREIYYVNEQGQNVHQVCLVPAPYDENWEAQNNKRILPVMRLLEAGRVALMQAKKESNQH